MQMKHAAADQAISCDGSPQLGSAVSRAERGQTQAQACWRSPGDALNRAYQREHTKGEQMHPLASVQSGSRAALR
eukprot:6175911-Pleurochrysis_carterae.AAC.2